MVSNILTRYPLPIWLPGEAIDGLVHEELLPDAISLLEFFTSLKVSAVWDIG